MEFFGFHHLDSPWLQDSSSHPQSSFAAVNVAIGFRSRLFKMCDVDLVEARNRFREKAWQGISLLLPTDVGE